MEAFPTKRAPDVGHLDDHEQKQLAYQLQRRAWAATASRASQQELLAEQRGANAVAARLRPIMADLFANLRRDQATGALTYTPTSDGDAVIALSLLAQQLNLGLSAPE